MTDISKINYNNGNNIMSFQEPILRRDKNWQDQVLFFIFPP